MSAQVSNDQNLIIEQKSDDPNAYDSDLYDEDGNYDEVNLKAKRLNSFQILDESLRHPDLAENAMYKNLVRKIKKFFI